MASARARQSTALQQQDTFSKRFAYYFAAGWSAFAVVFFFGIMFARYMGDGESGMTVLGIAVMLFLGLAIGRNLWTARRP